MKSMWLLLIAGLINSGIVWADSFTDDFARVDTGVTTDGSVIGDGYFIPDTGNPSFEISDGQLAVGALGAYEDSLLIYTNLLTVNSGNGLFRIKTDITYGGLSPTLSGLVFNYQDEQNYYMVQFRAYSSDQSYLQFRQRKNGSESAIQTVYLSELTNNVAYTLSVSSATVGEFDVSLTGGATDATYRWTDTQGALSNGYAGVYADRANGQAGGIRFDDLLIESYEVDMKDDFNRDDTAVTTDGSVIGSGYLIPDTGDPSFQISGGQLVVGGLGAYEDSLLVYTGISAANSGNASFEVSTEITYDWLSPSFSGMVLNYQDEQNYYIIQFRAYSASGSYIQLRRRVNGAESSLATVYLPELTNDVVYALKVFSETTGEFDVSLVGGETDVSYHWVDSESELTDGYVGLFADRANGQAAGIRFDNFYIIADSGLGDSYTSWIYSYGLTDTGGAGSMNADPDSDGLSNLAEYALGGNPTNSAVRGYSVVASLSEQGGANWLKYVHFERADKGLRGLSYAPERIVSLGETNWNSTGFVMVGSGSYDSEFNVVTNQLEIDSEDIQFVRLRITQQ